MLDDKRFQAAWLTGGLLLAALSILIDPIRGHDVYFATSQVITMGVGIIVFLAGLIVIFLRRP